jgi:polyribonucleotide nucleotidyltransferase
MGSPSGDIGHGALAQRALEASLPTEDFRQIASSPRRRVERLVVDGSVCGSTLAPMDAGVPIMVRLGIAMGLVKEGDSTRS